MEEVLLEPNLLLSIYLVVCALLEFCQSLKLEMLQGARLPWRVLNWNPFAYFPNRIKFLCAMYNVYTFKTCCVDVLT
jgi:hypothetical protein